jgi:hypothetical protein
MNFHKIACFAVIATALVLASSYASAQTLTYTLEGVTFNDGSTASGSFTFNSTTDVFTSWALSTTATPVGNAGLDGGVGLGAATYVSTGPSGANVFNATGFQFDNGTGGFNNGNDLDLLFKGGLTGAGGTVPLGSVVGDGSESQNSGFLSRTVVSGEVVAAVPEPSTYALMIAGIAVLAWWRRRQHGGPVEQATA